MGELLANETLVMRWHRHWFRLVNYLLLPILAVGLLLVIDVISGNRIAGDLRLLVLLVAAAAGGVWAIVGWIRWTADTLTLTDQRVILELGIFSRSSKVIALDRVTDVGTRQSMLGMIFGFGTVEIHTASMGGVEEFTYVPFPDRVRDEVFVQSARQRQPRPVDLTPPPSTPVTLTRVAPPPATSNPPSSGDGWSQ